MTTANSMTWGPITTVAAFNIAARQLMPALLRYAHRLTRDRSQSEDLVQETLMRAWAARDRFIPHTNLKAWLFRIQYNCFLSILRKTRRIVQLDPDVGHREPAAPAMQEEGLMLHDLAIAIAALPGEQAVALTLVNDEELTYEQAAQQLGVAAGTMKSRAARGRATLRKFLAGNTPEAPQETIPPPDTSGSAVPIPARDRPAYQRWKLSGRGLIG